MTKDQPDASSGRRSSRKTLWLALAIVLAAGAYTVGWFTVAGRLETSLPKFFQQAAKQGIQPVCSNAEITGYPLRMGINCQSTAVDFDKQGIKVTLGKLFSAAPVYNPRHVTSTFEGPVNITGADDLSAQFDWEFMRTDAVLAKNGLNSGSAEGKRVSISADSRELPFRLNAEIGHFSALARRDNTDLRISIAAEDFTSPLALDTSTFKLEATILSGATFMTGGQEPSLRGKTLHLETLNAALTEGGEIGLTGNIAIGDDGLANGDLRIRLTDYKAVAKSLEDIQPELAEQIIRFGPTLAALDIEPGDGAQTITLPFTVRQGEIAIGIFGLGDLPIFK